MASLGYSPIVHPHEVASNDVYQAWGEYTGFPGLITGGLGALGFNVVSQAGQVKSGTSIFAASRYGFALALLLIPGTKLKEDWMSQDSIWNT